VPGTYTAPHIGTILGDIVNPSKWRDSIDYLLYRTTNVPAAPASVQVGLNSELAQQIFPNEGPYSLLERIGPGDARGQFNGPRGIATASNGTVYVVDSNNARIEVFNADGSFVTIWDAQSGVVDLTISSQGLGPTGIAVGNDGLIYVADTWGHRVVVLDSSGGLVREFGAFADNQDATDASPNPGTFFGPRAVAVTDDEIYVVDTGNERVEVFGPDGSFKRAFGGKGSGPGQLSEPVGVTIGPDGLVYVADSGNGRISIFTQDGTPVAQWPVQAWLGHAYFEPYLAFGTDGLLYATSSATGSVEVIGKGGVLLGSITSAGTQPLGKPTGITAAADGSLLVTDTDSSGVYRIEPLEVPNLSEVAITAGDAATPQAVASPSASPAASPVP
jgi:streptogramin lyase